MSKITVGCRLPTGLILRLDDGQGNETQVELKGQNADMNGAIFIQPTLFVSARVSWFDKNVIDVLIESIARGAKRVANLDDLIDRYVVDGLVNLVSAWVWSLGTSLKSVQTGRLRQIRAGP